MKVNVYAIKKGIIKSLAAAGACVLIVGTAQAQKPEGSKEPVNFEMQSTNGLQATDKAPDAAIRFYPNPSPEGTFYVATEVKMYIQVYDRMMRPLLNRRVLCQPGKHVLDLTHLGTGYYIADLETDTGKETINLVIR